MMLIYVPVKFEFDRTNRFRVRVRKRKMWTDRQTDVGHISLIGGLVTRNPPNNQKALAIYVNPCPEISKPILSYLQLCDGNVLPEVDSNLDWWEDTLPDVPEEIPETNSDIEWWQDTVFDSENTSSQPRPSGASSNQSLPSMTSSDQPGASSVFQPSTTRYDLFRPPWTQQSLFDPAQTASTDQLGSGTSKRSSTNGQTVPPRKKVFCVRAE